MTSANGAKPAAPFLQSLVRYQLQALAFQRPPQLTNAATLLLVHTLGFLALGYLWSFKAALGLYLFLLLGGWLLGRLRRGAGLALLAPFWFVYAEIAARYGFIRLAHGTVPGYFDYALPDPRVLLHFEFAVVAALAYALLIALALILESRARALSLGAVIGTGAILGWAATSYFGQRTFGATGSDPYAYVQMAVDLVRNGTPAHHFALFSTVVATKLSWFPILHVGYHLPFNATGDAITVWSVGGSFAYALAYRLGGEAALYLVNPFFSLLGAGVGGLLAWELMRGFTQTMRLVTALATALLLATSNEIVNWAGVTMVDAQALVLSTLAFYAALRVYRAGGWGWAIATGMLWGAAYFIRHTQLVIALGFLPLFWFAPVSTRIRVRNLLLCGLVAFVCALPDLWYHQTYLGNWLHPESEELALFSLNAVASTLGSIAQSAFVAAEFGWLVLFLLLGIGLYSRARPVTSAALGLWLLAALVIQLPYTALRLRDLIPEFPILAFYISFGIMAGVVALWRRQRVWAQVAAAVLVFGVLQLSLVRVWNTLPRGIGAPPDRFGAMSQAQRASFDAIAQLTPANAVIGASLNSGALDLYAQRATFRPEDWSPEELQQFLTLVQRQARPVYFLEDSNTLDPVLKNLRGTYPLERVATLDVPLFGTAAEDAPGALWRLDAKP